MKEIICKIKSNKDFIFAFILGIIMPISVVCASFLYNSSSVYFNNTVLNLGSGNQSISVQDAIDNLKSKCDDYKDLAMVAMCPKCKYGYVYSETLDSSTSLSYGTTVNTLSLNQSFDAVLSEHQWFLAQSNYSNGIHGYVCSTTYNVPYCLEGMPSSELGVIKTRTYQNNKYLSDALFGSNCVSGNTSSYYCQDQSSSIHHQTSCNLSVDADIYWDLGTYRYHCKAASSGKLACYREIKP